MPNAKVATRRRSGRGGRPRADEIEKLNEGILAAAGELFLQHGFDGTSMDAIAAKARISKRTLYARHADKLALFNTVMYDLLGRYLVPVEAVDYGASDLRSALLAVGRDMATGVLRPEFLAVYRLVAFEAQRRPEFGRWINDTRRRPALHVIAGILQRHRDELRLSDFETMAELFMSLTVDLHLRLAAFGFRSASADVDAKLHSAVDLFLNGARAERQNDATRQPRRAATRT